MLGTIEFLKMMPYDMEYRKATICKKKYIFHAEGYNLILEKGQFEECERVCLCDKRNNSV